MGIKKPKKNSPAKSPKTSLAPMQELFAREYLKDLNAKQAAVRAGYSEDTAQEQGSRLLSNVKVASKISELMAERNNRLAVSSDRILLEIERLAMFDPKDLASLTGPEQIKDLPEDVRRAIVGWGFDKMGNFQIKLAKEKALEMLGRHYKLFTDRVEHTGGVAVVTTELDAKQFKELRDKFSSEY